MKFVAAILLCMLAVAVFQRADADTSTTDDATSVAATSTTEGDTDTGTMSTVTEGTETTTSDSGAGSLVAPVSLLLATSLLILRRLC